MGWANGPGGATGPPGPVGPQGIQGIQGIQGDGVVWIVGAGAPAAGTGQDGDMYLRTNGDVHGPKAAGAWPAANPNITGPQGPQGIQGIQGVQGNVGAQGAQGIQGNVGAQGPAGVDGKTPLDGAGAPGAGLGNNGDYYLNTTNGDWYEKAAGAWGLILDISTVLLELAGGTLTGPLVAAVGSAAAPSITFAGDTDTGLFWSSANQLGITANGTLRVIIGGGQIKNADGNAGGPAYSFSSDLDMGFYRIGADSLGVSLGGTSKVRFEATYLGPVTDNAISCGASGQRWTDVWAANATIQTSDATEKREVVTTPLGLSFIRRLQPRRYYWLEGIRPHDGLIAQEVREALDAEGVGDAAVYIDPAIQHDLTGPPVKPPKPKKPARPERAKVLRRDFATSEDYAVAGATAEQAHALEIASWEAEYLADVERWESDFRVAAEGWEAGRNGPKGLRYDELIAPMIRAQQEVVAILAEVLGRIAQADDLAAVKLAARGALEALA